MILNTYISLQSFLKGWNQESEIHTLSLPAVNLMHILPLEEYEYGLSLLRQSIRLYERKQNIPLHKSKQSMPFFRENRRMLVGPEVEMYIMRIYEGKTDTSRLLEIESPLLQLSFDYEQLAEYCLLENCYLIRCKYDADRCLETFTKQMEREYDTFFYDDEHTGFTSDSRFFSMLCNACMEIRRPEHSDEKEWNMALFRQPSEVEYDFTEAKLTPFISVPIPLSCIKRISMLNRDKDVLSFSALAGFLQKIGLSPELYLEGLIEE